MVNERELSDEQLALRSSQGDRDAFAELYARYFQGLYDLTLRMVRDQEIAADLVQNSFIRAWESLQKRRVSGNLRAWLYAIARNAAINEIRRKNRWGAILSEPSSREETPAFEGIDSTRLSNPEAALEAQELVDLVWSSAAALGPKDYSLLDLHLRRDLAPGEIAAGLGLPNARVHTMLSRLKSSLEESVSIALLIRRGRRDCPQLNEILYRRETDVLSRDIKLEVRRHLQECEQCAASRKKFVAPAEIFSAIAVLPVSDEMVAGVWSKISPSLVPGAASIGGAVTLAGSRAVRWWGQAGASLKVATVAVLTAVVALPVAVSLLLISTGGSAGSGDTGGADLTGNAGISASRTRPPQETRTPVKSASPTPTPLVAGAVESPAPASSGSPTPTLPAGAAPTAAPTPTFAGSTATPQTSATTTPTPLPANQADVMVTEVGVSATVLAGQVTLSPIARLLNKGGADVVYVDTTFTLVTPAGCSSASPVTAKNTKLLIETEVAVGRPSAWSVLCSVAGNYRFTVMASAVISPGQTVTDPDLTNNSGSGSVPVIVAP